MPVRCSLRALELRFSGFICSLRLEHAAGLVKRRASLRTGQPIGEFAYASGSRDYSHFARKFRQRFGYAAGAYGATVGPASDFLALGL